jgi:Icc-related predicted phosphoesterase
MRFWILSDLHIELTRGWDLPPASDRPDYDVLVVAGDLIPRMDRGVRWLASRVTDRPVVYVAGNHEAYGQDIDRTVAKAREAASGTNIHVLQNDSILIDGVKIIGTSLWTDFNLFGNARYAMQVAGDVMNDYRKIRTGDYFYRLRPAHTLARHMVSRSFIEGELRNFSGPRVVVTHHSPVPATANRVEEVNRKNEPDMISAAYRSDLRELIIRERPDLWIFGHTHESSDQMVGGARVLTNGKGYGPWLPAETAWDNPLFDPKLVVEI